MVYQSTVTRYLPAPRTSSALSEIGTSSMRAITLLALAVLGGAQLIAAAGMYSGERLLCTSMASDLQSSAFGRVGSALSGRPSSSMERREAHCRPETVVEIRVISAAMQGSAFCAAVVETSRSCRAQACPSTRRAPGLGARRWLPPLAPSTGQGARRLWEGSSPHAIAGTATLASSASTARTAPCATAATRQEIAVRGTWTPSCRQAEEKA